jgi:hypothetical protein
MFNQYTIEITKHNLITLLGESFLMNRLINDRLQPIQYIALGKGTARPQKKDTRLGKQTIRKTCNTEVDLTNKQLILSCDFEAKEILDTTEIGVITNDDILITHDLYETITSTILGNSTSSIHLEYNIIFTTGGIRSQWKTSTTQNNILYTYEPNKVVNVIEYNTNSGYVKVNSLNDLKTTKGAYYYDIASKNLYIRTTRSNTLNNISDMEIIVQTK